MSKTVSIILIIILSILTVASIGLFVLLLKGDINFNLFNLSTYSENLIESKEFNSIEDLNINCDIGDVIIEEGNDEIIKVELYSEDSEDYYIKEENNTIMIKLNAKKNKMNFLKKSNKISIKLPSNYDKTIKVNTTTGDVKTDSFKSMKLDVEGTTGDIKVGEINSLEFKLSTGDIKADKLNYISGKLSTGDIKIGKVEEFSAATTTGDIVIDNVYKRIYARTTTGDIKISSAEIKEDSTIGTTTGDVKIETLTGAYIEANAGTGDIKVNNNDRKLEKTVKINTSTGDIKVNR